MAFWDFLKPNRGRPRNEPKRDTLAWPNLTGLGVNGSRAQRVVYKPSRRNLRYFSRTPLARRAINAIKNPISMLDWEIATIADVDENNELRRQIELVSYCLQHPNNDDNFQTLIAQLVEDILCGAGAVEVGRGGDPQRPVWLWPVDGLSIQIFPGWAGGRSEARYLQTVGYGSYSTATGQGVTLRNDELIYIRPNPTTASPFGFGPLEIAFESISRALSTADFAGKVAGNSLPPFMIDLGEVSPDTVKVWRSYWENDIEGQGKIPIIGTEISDPNSANKARGATAIRLYPEGDKALYLAYQEFLRQEIAAAFDLSNMNLNLERDVNRSTSEVQEDKDWDGAIKPMAHLIKAHIDRDVIQGTFGFSQIQLQWKGLDREDEQATSQILGSYFDRGLYTIDEVRSKLGEAPADHQWGWATSIDLHIAENAARSAGVIEDTKLPVQGGKGAQQPAKPAATAKPK